MKNKYYYAPVYIIVLIFFITGCSSGFLPPPKSEVPEQQEVPRLYEFTLSTEKPEGTPQDEYSRREIESFLCAFAPGFIETDDVYKAPPNPKPEFTVKEENVIIPAYAAKYKEIDEKQKETLENLEITKWFEERVTYVIKGHAAPEDTAVVNLFFHTLNTIMGKIKFIHEQAGEVGNIVIEFQEAPPPNDPAAYMGESVRLDDNLRTLFYMVNKQMKVDTYKVQYGKLRSKTQAIRYSAAEKAFREKNRIVKLYITAVPDASTKKTVILHELLHAVGFNGHSPYTDSNLFPLPVAVKNEKGAVQGIFSALTGRMLEILYRPEMLPTMTIKEARDLLSHLKVREKTPPEWTAAYLRETKKNLEKEKETILDGARAMFERRDEIIRLLNKLDMQKEKLLKELKKENKLAAEIVKDKSYTEIIRLNREAVEQQLALLVNDNTRAKQMAQRKEDLEVWDAIKGDFCINEKRKTELETEEKNMFEQEEEINERLRKIVRRLKTIESELK